MASPYYIPVDQPNPLTKMAEMMKVQEAMDEVGKKKKLARFLGSGVDLNTTDGLRRLMEVDPEYGYKLAVKQSTIAANQALGAQRQAKTGQIDAKQLAGGAAMLVKQYETLPPEQRTPQAFTSIWGPAVQLAKQRGLAPPDMPLEGATYDQVKSIVVGAGFSPAEQAKAQLGQDELSEETQYDAVRLGQHQQGIENLEKNRGAVLAQDQSQFGSREARLGSEFRTREGNIGARADRNFRQGAYEFERDQGLDDRKFNQDAGMEERKYKDLVEGKGPPQKGGFEMSYDAEGRPVVSMGGSGKPFTGEQAKALANITLAESANNDMDTLAAEGFDATSALGAAGVQAAGTPGLNIFAPEQAQRQNSANIAFAQSINYQRSGAATPEPEYNRAVQSVIEKYSDKPETKAAKRNYRIALVEAVKAQDPRIDMIVKQILATERGGDPNKAGRPPANDLRMPQPFRSPTQSLSRGGSGSNGGSEKPEDTIKRLMGR